VLLSELLGRRVVGPAGTLGRVADLSAHSGGRVATLILRGEPAHSLAWKDVTVGEDELVVVADRALEPPPLLLGRDILDAQVFDLAGRRLTRVADVVLAADGTVEAVEVGLAGVLRRLGLPRLAARAWRRTIPWSHVHPTSAHGHALMLEATVRTLRAHPLDLRDTLIGHLPPHRAQDVVRRLGGAIPRPRRGFRRHARARRDPP
jgi:sporulation protein YlmC with PRC-barrel domain